MINPNTDVIETFLKQFLPWGISVTDFYIGMICLIIISSIMMMNMRIGNRNHFAARIKAIKQRRKDFANETLLPKKRKRPESSVNFMRMVAMKFQLVKKLQLEKAETTLIQAGFRSKDALVIFAFLNLIVPIIFFSIGIIIMETRPENPSAGIRHILKYIWPLASGYIGLKLPWFLINRAKKKRYLKIQRALSDTLDLMTVCAEAGLSMPAAMDRVSRELGIVYPEMAAELGLTAIEINFYPDRNRALTNLAYRCDLKEVRGIVTVLIQTEKYGTPIAQALRVLASEFRQTRMMMAEGKAARLPAIMTLPMIVFILPTVFIIIMTPAVISVKKNMGAFSGKSPSK